MCMLNLAVAPSLKQQLVDNMKINPFSVSVDGSNDTGVKKMYPLTITIYGVSSGKIVTQFLDICTSTSSTTEAIYTKMDDRLSNLLALPNPWNICTSVCVDNTSVNIYVRNSLKTRILKQNGAIYFNGGCSCYIIIHIMQLKRQ